MAKAISRWAWAKRVSESISSRTFLPLSRKYSAIRVQYMAARKRISGASSAGEATTALVEGVEAMDGYFARFLPTRMSAAALPLLMIAVAAIASPICAAIMLATLIPFIAAMILAGTAAAAEARIVVRPYGQDGVRVTIGAPEENDALLRFAQAWI